VVSLLLFVWSQASLSPLAAQSDLDAFMKNVLARRDENWKKLQQYVLDERDQIELRGPSAVPIWGERREYRWFIREGYFVKSPVKVNGVNVPEEERARAEDRFLRRVKERDKKAPPGEKKPEQPAAGADQAAVTATQQSPDVPPSLDSFLRQTREPDFIDSAYFLRFKFEQGKYALVGRETFEGQEVLRIEYYPTRLFSDEPDKEPVKDAEAKTARDRRNDDFETTIQRLMNKVSLVTLWVDPKQSQIVKYTFDNVNFDFLPAAWLVRVKDLKMSMTMSQAFKDVWLPRTVDFYFSGMFAIGPFDGRYHVDYLDYRQAATSGRIRSPEAR
jgi:hypothetical protein